MCETKKKREHEENSVIKKEKFLYRAEISGIRISIKIKNVLHIFKIMKKLI